MVINEAPNYVEKDAEGNPLLSGTVHDFINKKFFQIQAIAIRRLLDKERSEGSRSVISLNRLLIELSEYCHLLTRANILDALGYPYDYRNVTSAAYSSNNMDELRLGLFRILSRSSATKCLGIFDDRPTCHFGIP